MSRFSDKEKLACLIIACASTLREVILGKDHELPSTRWNPVVPFLATELLATYHVGVLTKILWDLTRSPALKNLTIVK